MSGDPAFPPELVTAHASSLRALARSLALDEHAADDVVQDTWLRAFTARPPSRDGLGGWLRRVAEGFALRRRRAEGRRAERERTYARERTEATTDARERAETLRIVVETVLELEEPYRETVLMRWFEDLPPRAIAARTGTTVATVNSRLQRAHARLRERLAARLDRRDLGALLVAIFGGETKAGAIGAVGWAAATILGVTMTTAKVAAAAAAVTIGVGAWWWTLQPAGDPAQPAVAPESAAAERATLDDPLDPTRPSARVVADGAETATAPNEVAAIDAPYVFELAVTLRDANGFPCPFTEVYIGLDDVRVARLGATDWLGTLRTSWRGFEPAARVVLQARRGGAVVGPLRRVDLVAGVPHEIESVCAPAAPAPRVTREMIVSSVVARRLSLHLGATQFATGEDGVGTFTDAWLARRVGASDPGATTSFLSARRRLTRSLAVTGVLGTRATEAEPPDGIRVRGHVARPTGDARAPVVVALLTSGGAREIVVTSEDGAYEFADVSPGEARLFVGGETYAVESVVLTDLAPGDTRIVDVAVRGLLPTRVVVRGADAAPLADVLVEARTPSGSVVDVGRTADDGGVPLSLPHGVFDLVARVGDADGPSVVLAPSFGSRPGEQVVVEAPPLSGRVAWDVRLDDEGAEGLVSARLWSLTTGDGCDLVGRATGAGGASTVAFEATRVPAGRWTVTVLAAGAAAREYGPFVSDGLGGLSLGTLTLGATTTVDVRAAGGAPSDAGSAAASSPAAASASSPSTPRIADDGEARDVVAVAGGISTESSAGPSFLAELPVGELLLDPVAIPSAESVSFHARRQGLRVTSGPIAIDAGEVSLATAPDARRATFHDLRTETSTHVDVEPVAGRATLVAPSRPPR